MQLHSFDGIYLIMYDYKDITIFTVIPGTYLLKIRIRIRKLVG